MTETADKTKRDDDRDGRGSQEDRPRRSRLSAREAANRAVEELTELLDVTPFGVVGLERLGSTWQVLVEVVELERVPETTNIIGEYSVDLDDDGEVVGYRRTRRYVRGRAEEEQ